MYWLAKCIPFLFILVHLIMNFTRSFHHKLLWGPGMKVWKMVPNHNISTILFSFHLYFIPRIHISEIADWIQLQVLASDLLLNLSLFFRQEITMICFKNVSWNREENMEFAVESWQEILSFWRESPMVLSAYVFVN